MTFANAEQTTIGAYRLVYTGDGTDTVPTAFPLGMASSDADWDLGVPKYGYVGAESKANRICFLFLADQAGTAVIAINGGCAGGITEPICSLACTVGGTAESGANRWVEDATLTSYHLAEDAIVLADTGNNQPTKLGFDNIGYQFLTFYTHTFVNVTSLKVYARYF